MGRQFTQAATENNMWTTNSRGQTSQQGESAPNPSGDFRRCCIRATRISNHGNYVASFVEFSATIHRCCAAFCRNPHNPLRVFEPFPPYAVGRQGKNLKGPPWFRIGSLLARCSFWARAWSCFCALARGTIFPPVLPVPGVNPRPAPANRGAACLSSSFGVG